MPKAIVVVVSDGFGGYGDFLFALKLAHGLKDVFSKTLEGDTSPPIYIVTQPSAQATIKMLGGDVEFGVEILTPLELKARVNATNPDVRIEVGEIIEGPVFKLELIKGVDNALDGQPCVPLTMISEYSMAASIETHVLYRDADVLKNMKYRKTILSGLGPLEEGIILSDFPVLGHSVPESLDSRIQAIIGDIDVYQSTTELSMQYSHDTYTTYGPELENGNPTKHFLEIHREYYLENNKNQDVLLIGRNIQYKKAALESVRLKLVADGFQRITFYNASMQDEEVLYHSGKPGKCYRAIYVDSMSHASMMMCRDLSGPLIGATGDQSFGEAVSANKIMVYELLSHKGNLIAHYDAGLIEESKNEVTAYSFCELLRTAAEPERYQRLGSLLRSMDVKDSILKSNQDFILKCNLIISVAAGLDIVDMPVVKAIYTSLKNQRILGHISNLLRHREEEEIIEYMSELKQPINIVEMYEGQQLFRDANLEQQLYTIQIAYLWSLKANKEILRLLNSSKKPIDVCRLMTSFDLKNYGQYAFDYAFSDFFKTCFAYLLMNGRYDEAFVLVDILRTQFPLQLNIPVENILSDAQLLESGLNRADIKSHYIEHLYPQDGLRDEPNVSQLLTQTNYFIECICENPKNEAGALEIIDHVGLEMNGSAFVNKESILELALENHCYSVVNALIKNTRSQGDVKILCDILQKKKNNGETYLSQLISHNPNNYMTGLACYWSTIQRLSQYQPKNKTRIRMYQSFQELIKVYNDSAMDYHHDAFVGLILLNVNHIKSEYQRTFFSPKGKLFGSKLYAICDLALRDLGIHLDQLTSDQVSKYIGALTRFVNQDPMIRINYPILGTLALQASVNLPVCRPMLSIGEAETVMAELNPLSLSEHILVPSASKNYFYVLNPTLLGRGNWGQVYQAERYDSDTLGNPAILAIKKMRARHVNMLASEGHLFRKVYPEQQIEQFTIGDSAYLTMPLFKGVQLDEYLDSHPDLSVQNRQLMIVELLNDLERLHDHGVTHNDLKTKNMLFDPIEVKMHIIDFGCAQDMLHPEQLQYTDIDSSIFAFEFPPEYLSHVEANRTLDIYAIASIIAEVLGVDKRSLVEARLMTALKGIEPELADIIQQAFRRSEVLGDAFFTSPLYDYVSTPEFLKFVCYYTLTPYDLSSYETTLGKDVIKLLNKMQSHRPEDRPTAQECKVEFSRLFGYSTKDSINALRVKLGQLKAEETIKGDHHEFR